MDWIAIANLIDGELRLFDNRDSARDAASPGNGWVDLRRQFLHAVDHLLFAAAIDDTIELIRREPQIAGRRFELVGRDAEQLADMGEELGRRQALELDDVELFVPF